MSRVRAPKDVKLVLAAAQAVLGCAVTAEFRAGARHPWRLRYGTEYWCCCSTPKNHEDQPRYARQWAQRMKKL